MLKHLRSHIFHVMAVFLAAFPFISHGQNKTTAKPTSTRTIAEKVEIEKIDINAASAESLVTLPGIGQAYAKRVVEGRPYANKGQLVSKGVLPAYAYDKIKDLVIAVHPKAKPVSPPPHPSPAKTRTVREPAIPEDASTISSLK